MAGTSFNVPRHFIHLYDFVPNRLIPNMTNTAPLILLIIFSATILSLNFVVKLLEKIAMINDVIAPITAKILPNIKNGIGPY